MSRAVGFVHASPAAIAPLMSFYNESAPDLKITNLLDDRLLGLLRSADVAAAVRRLGEMIATARDAYHARAVLLSCSALPLAAMPALKADAGIPLLKIDVPMARLAVAKGGRIGVAVTFSPAVEPTRQLLLDTAAEASRQIEVCLEIAAAAYQALLAGDTPAHDRLLLEAIRALAAKGVDSIVLAQVSMAGVREEARRLAEVPVYSSLETSLAALRELLETKA